MEEITGLVSLSLGVAVIACVTSLALAGNAVAALASLRTSARVRDTMASSIFSSPSMSLTKYKRLPSALQAISRSRDGGEVTRATGDFSSMLRTKTSPYATKAMVFPSGLNAASEISLPTRRTSTASTVSMVAVRSIASGRGAELGACAASVRAGNVNLYNLFQLENTTEPFAETSKLATSSLTLVNFSPATSAASLRLRR